MAQEAFSCTPLRVSASPKMHQILASVVFVHPYGSFCHFFLISHSPKLCNKRFRAPLSGFWPVQTFCPELILCISWPRWWKSICFFVCFLYFEWKINKNLWFSLISIEFWIWNLEISNFPENPVVKTLIGLLTNSF